MKIGIKTKLMLWYSVLSSLIMAAFFIFIYLIYSRSLLEDLRRSLEADAQTASYETQIMWEAVKLTTDFSQRQTLILIYTEDNRLLFGTPPEHASLPVGMAPPGTYQVGTREESWLVCDMPLFRLQYTGWVRAIKPVAPIQGALHNLLVIMILSLPVFVLVSAVGGFQIAKRAFLPISRMVQTANQIGKGDLSKRIALEGIDDEIGELADTLDEMLDKLEQSFLREKQFANDASHELRTPTAVIMSYAEEALSGEKSAGEYRKSLETILGESKKMKEMISGLLLLARNYERGDSLEFERIDVSLLTEIVLEQIRPACREQDIALSADIQRGVYAEVDQTLLMHILMNLLENAVKYNKPGGSVNASVRRDGAEVVFSVADTGIGMTQEEQEHIFNRFYRSDQAKAGTLGHGLGLAIVRWMVSMHSGSILVKSEPGAGSTFLVRIPIQGPAPPSIGTISQKD